MNRIDYSDVGTSLFEEENDSQSSEVSSPIMDNVAEDRTNDTYWKRYSLLELMDSQEKCNTQENDADNSEITAKPLYSTYDVDMNYMFQDFGEFPPIDKEDTNLSCSSNGMDESVCSSVHDSKVPSPTMDNVVDDSTSGAYTEEEEVPIKCDEKNKNVKGERSINYWTDREMALLEEGVKLYGTENNWKKIAAHVGGRNASQCVNKWKNHRSEKWKRWNKDATKVLKGLINQGLSFEEIQERMSDHTYIQIFQHHQKFTMNHGPWEDWEVKLLIILKKEGRLSDTEIGKKLDNRHKDSVKCKWNEIKKKYQLD